MKKYDDVIASIKNAKKDIKNDLINMFKKYNITEIDCTEQDDCPIVFNGMGDDCMTLDRVVYYPQYNRVVFEGSGSYTNEYFELNNLDFEILLDVFSWICSYEKELFAGEDEE